MTTLADAKAKLAAHGYLIKKTDYDDYRVYPKGTKDPELGYFTDDLDDAVATGIAMAQKAAPAVQERRRLVRSSTQQPVWKEVGTVGDVNFPEYDGGVVSVDTTGVYPPELEYIEVPADDDDFESPRARWTVYRVVLDRGVPNWGELESVADSTGQDPDDLRESFESDDPMKRASAYMDWAGHYGWHEFDPYPLTLTRAQTEKRYDADLGYKRGIESALEEEVGRRADEDAATGWSHVNDQLIDELTAEGFDPESIVIQAEFGDAVAVNEDVLVGGWGAVLGVKSNDLWSEIGTQSLDAWLDVNGYEYLDRMGGHVPSDEGHASGYHVIYAVAEQLKLTPKEVAEVAKSLDWWQEEIPRDTSGRTYVWAKKKSGTTEERRRPMVRAFGREAAGEYHTQSGIVGAKIHRSVDRDGRVTYSYTGKWGAGSGLSAADMQRDVRDWLERKRGIQVITPFQP